MANEPTIGEMNKVIAEFMGAKDAGNGFVEIPGRVYSLSSRNYPHSLRYNLYWDWLMPVGKKIRDILSEMLKQRPPHTACNGDLIEVDIHCAISEYDIEKAHHHMYQFITWYNDNQQKQTESE